MIQHHQRSAFLLRTNCTSTELPTLLAEKIAELLGTKAAASHKKIQAQTHPQVRWLAPEKRVYKKNELTVLLAEAEQQQQKPLVFIITQAELLQDQSANSLLKLLEEPPRNIFFILTAANEQQIIPTIRSRLFFLPTTEQEKVATTHPLIRFFLKTPIGPIKELHELLKDKNIDDVASRELFDTLIAAWHEQNKDGNPNAPRTLKILLFFAEQPPMPGSSRLFWRTIYASLIVQK